MSLRVKAGIDLEELKKYGFKTGKEWADAGERCLEGIGYEYQHEWYHKFLMDADEPMVYEVKPLFFRGRVREALWRKLRDQYLNMEAEIEIER